MGSREADVSPDSDMHMEGLLTLCVPLFYDYAPETV